MGKCDGASPIIPNSHWKAVVPKERAKQRNALGMMMLIPIKAGNQLPTLLGQNTPNCSNPSRRESDSKALGTMVTQRKIGLRNHMVVIIGTIKAKERRVERKRDGLITS